MSMIVWPNDPILPPHDPRATIVTDPAELPKWHALLKDRGRRRWIAADTETSGFDYFKDAEAIGFPFGYDLGDGVARGVYFPIRHQTIDRQLPVDWTLWMVRDLLQDPELTVVGHNVKFDMHFWQRDGIETRCQIHDTMLMVALIDENRSKEMESCALDFGLDDRAYEMKAIVSRLLAEECKRRGIRKRDAPGYSWIPVPVLGRYGCKDGYNTLALGEKLLPIVQRHWGQLYETERKLLRYLQRAEYIGTPIDLDYLRGVHVNAERKAEQLRAEINRLAGAALNVASDAEMRHFLFEHLKFEPTHYTKNGRPDPYGETEDDRWGTPAVDERAIKALIRKNRPGTIDLLRTILDWRAQDKILTTYTTPIIEKCDARNYLHTSLNQVRANTGRMSCVSGSTPLETTRGTFRFDEYTPVVGDMVATHEGRFRRVVRKIYKGVAKMFRVCLANGSTIECTAEHLFLTRAGWRSLGEMAVGDKVLSYVRLQELREQPEERRSGNLRVSGGAEADARNASPRLRDDVSQRSAHRHKESLASSVEVRAGASLLTIQDGIGESNVGKEWFPTPRIHWERRRRQGIFAEESERHLRVRSSVGNGGSVGASGASRELRRSSHRRESEEQRSGQSRLGDARWARAASCEDSEIREITSLGEMGVWDIEVEGDHSYAAAGFFNHNSSGPNLQNIPTPGEDGDEDAQLINIRRAFLVPPGRARIYIDFSQVELRVLAYYSKDPTMVAAFVNGEDIHTRTSLELFNSKEKKWRRVAKVINFGLSYGMSPMGVMENLNATADPSKGIEYVTEQQSEEYLARFHTRYPRVMGFCRELWTEMRKHTLPQFTNLFGRTRRIADLASFEKWRRSRAERQAVASMIQGTAADIAKVSMVRVGERLDEARAAGRYEGSFVLTVHDENQMDVDIANVEEAARELQRDMQHFPQFAPIDITAEVEVSTTNWSDKKPLGGKK